MHYTRADAQRLVYAITKNIETYKDVDAKEVAALEVLENPQKWNKIPCESRAQANKEYLVARTRKNEFVRASNERKQAVSILAAEVKKSYEAKIAALQMEKACFETLADLYTAWEEDSTKIAPLEDFLCNVVPFVEDEQQEQTKNSA